LWRREISHTEAHETLVMTIPSTGEIAADEAGKSGKPHLVG